LQPALLVEASSESNKAGVQNWCNSGLCLDAAPAKIRQLDKINKILAHRPWMINKYHIRELCVKSEANGNECWSLSEIVQALTLLAHFHSFSSFILGCGLMHHPNKKNDADVHQATDAAAAPIDPSATLDSDSAIKSSSSRDEDHEGSAAGGNQDVDVAAGDVIDDKVPLIMEKLESLGAKEQEELEMEELNRRFQKIEESQTQDVPLLEGPSILRSRSHTPDPDLPDSSSHPATGQSSVSSSGNGIVGANGNGSGGKPAFLPPTRFTHDLSDFQYVDFVKRDDPASYPTCRSLEYNWEEHAYPTLGQFYNEEVSRQLDEKFKTIDSLTYRTIGSYQSVDTTLFRRAIQYYVQCLYGIRHDDYDYSLVNELLPRRLKKYIKTVSCYPERCTNEEYQSIMIDFLTSEKVHVCLLVCEARLQSALLYGCKAISDFYMDKNC